MGVELPDGWELELKEFETLLLGRVEAAKSYIHVKLEDHLTAMEKGQWGYTISTVIEDMEAALESAAAAPAGNMEG